jgi:hypothetical protein
MPIIVSENIQSRTFEVGVQQDRELLYDVFGTNDDGDVQVAVDFAAPTAFRGLVRETIHAEPVGHLVWKAVVRYRKVEDDDEYTFDTTGGTANVKQSLFTVANYARSGETAPNFHGAINVTEDKVEGVDIVSRKYEWSETHDFDDADITDDYKRTLFRMTGTVNDSTFRNIFNEGECIFLGAIGAKRGYAGKWRLTFKFAGEPNITGMSIGSDESYYSGGDIDGIDKEGWDYLWVRHADFEDTAAKSIVKRPLSAHVERVYYRTNFALLEIGV